MLLLLLLLLSAATCDVSTQVASRLTSIRHDISLNTSSTSLPGTPVCALTVSLSLPRVISSPWVPWVAMAQALLPATHQPRPHTRLLDLTPCFARPFQSHGTRVGRSPSGLGLGVPFPSSEPGSGSGGLKRPIHLIRSISDVTDNRTSGSYSASLDLAGSGTSSGEGSSPPLGSDGEGSGSMGHSGLSGTPSPRHSQGRARLTSSRWTRDDDDKLRQLVEKYGAKSWHMVAAQVGPQYTAVQCMCRWKNVLCPDVRKGPWTIEEDKIVRDCVLAASIDKVKWREVANLLPGRLGKQCRERWYNQLDPNINPGTFSSTPPHLLPCLLPLPVLVAFVHPPSRLNMQASTL